MKTLNNLLFIFAILTFVANAQYVVRYGLSSSAYQSEFNNWVGTQKMRLADVSGYNRNGQETYAAIFTSTPGPEWTARHHMDEASYQAAVTDLSNQGWRPNRISAFEVNGAPMFAAIFTKPQGAWVARHDLLPADYQAQFNSWTGQGYRLIEVCGYTKGGATRYAAVWEKSAGPGYYAFNGLTAAQYQTTFTDQAKNGFIPVRVSGYEVGGTDYYAAIFQQSNSGVYARHRLTEHDFSAEFNNGWYTGKTMIHLDGYTVGGSVRFAALWTGGSLSSKDASTIDNLVSTYMSNFHAPGVSIGVMKDERLVWAKGYGVEDKSTGALASTSSMFRIASVSKPITAIAIMKLTETHGLKLTDLLFGPTGLLGDICSQVDCMDKDDLNKITVQHCLEHSTGYDGNDAVWVQYQLNNADLIKWVAQNYLQLDHPGVQYMYNNYGYFLLARVIEKKTGMLYQDYVKRFILSPCGITDMYIGADSQNQKGPNEVTYYPDQNNGDPYALHLTRMDGNGGWVSHPISLLKVVACVDKKSNRPDILSPSTIDVMRTHSTANGAGSYAKGWIVDGDQWTHNGCMSGTLAILKHYSNGISVAITVNTRSANDGCDWNGVYPLADAISSGGISWPSSNLF